MVARWLTILVLCAGAIPLAAARVDGTPVRNFKPDAVIVAYKTGISTTRRAGVRQAVHAVRWQRLMRLAPTLEALELPPGTSVSETLKKLQQNPDVRFAEPDYRITVEATANDPYYTSGSLWGMYGDATSPANTFGSRAGEAWSAGHIGSRSVVVGIVDEGVDISHPDLAPNIWTNPFEVAGNGLDDDGNGYIDDIHGWDFYFRDASVFDGPTVDTHGTHVAGTVGAVGGDARGVVGVNWEVTMIPVKFMHAGAGDTSDAILALDYLTDLKTRHGLPIVATNNSWGSAGESQALTEAINRAGDQGILFVATAGNSGVNADINPHYPSHVSCTTRSRGEDCLVSVAAIAANGARASFSNYGTTSVDLGAPGVDINSTQPGNSYMSFDGTSMAAPHVTGALALCKAVNPALSMSDLRALLMRTGVATASLAGVTVTGRRLDVAALATACAAAAGPVDAAPSSLAVSATARSSISLSWSDNSSNESVFEVQRSPAGCAAFATIDHVTADATAYTATGLSPSTSYCFRVRGRNPSATPSAWSAAVTGTTTPPPPGYDCVATTAEWVSPAGGQSYVMQDDSQIAVNLPFNVPFYGETISTLTISSNGFVRMGVGASSAWFNTTLPSVGAPNGLVAVYWDDLNPGSGGSVLSRVIGTAPSRQFVVAWTAIPHYNAPLNPVSVQLVIEEGTGTLHLNYLDTDHGDPTLNAGLSATAGTEDALGELASLVSFNQALLPSGSSLRCSTAPPPATPTGLVATATASNAVALTWTDGADEIAYVIERATGSGEFFELAMTGTNTTSYGDTGLTASTAYRYRMKARNAMGDSAYSTEATATTLPTLPATPSGVSVTNAQRSVTVRWVDASTNETRFEIGRATFNAGTSTWSATSMIATSPANTTTRTIGTEIRGTHRYYVRARNAAGTSAWRGPTRIITIR